MRAAVLFGPNDLRIVDKPIPQPGPGEVLVKIAMCGTCGTDLKLQTHPFPYQPPFGQFTPGHEWTGTVVRLGETVDEVAVGDRVAIEAHRGCGRCDNCVVGMYTACLNYGDLGKGHRASGMTVDGGFAEYALHHVSSLYKLPENLTWEDAVLVTTAGTSLYGLDAIGGYIAGQSVVVIGAGPVGLMTTQVCNALGADPVVLIGTRPARLELGGRLGGVDRQPKRRHEDVRARAGGGQRVARRGGTALATVDPAHEDRSTHIVQVVTVQSGLVTHVEEYIAPGRRSRARAINAALDAVSEHLGNTRAVARASYVDPRVLEHYVEGRTILAAVRRAGTFDLVDEQVRTRLERALLRLLR